MIKKIGSLALFVGGILAVIGVIGTFVSASKVSVSNLKAMDIMIKMTGLARAGAIVVFVGAIIAVAGVCMSGVRKNGAITSLAFAVLAFVGQILISPITNWESAAEAALSGNAETLGISAAVGLMLIGVSGFALIIMGIAGLASKSRIATLNDQ